MAAGRGARVVSIAMLCAATLCPIVASAQRGQDAGLVGTVRDPSSAVVAGASVTVSSPQMIGGAQTVRSDAQGTYRFAFLPPGEYVIVAEQAGFRSTMRSGIALQPGLTFTLDFTLAVAAMNEDVTVKAVAPVVDVGTSAVTTLVDRKLLENLPLSRNARDTVNLAPGVARNVAFGGSVSSNPFSLDGANGNEPGWGTPTVTPNLNWMEELQVVSIGADARYGEFTGALTNAITRSGSNRFSGFGDLWTTRPGWTGNNRGNLTPQLQDQFRPIDIIRRWDSDVQLGGPLARDRLWFFSGGEVYRNVYRPISFSGPRTADEPRYDETQKKVIAKLTGAIATGIRAEGFYSRELQGATGGNAGPLTRPEALAVENIHEMLWNARLLWTPGSRAFLEVRHGGNVHATYWGPPDDRRSGPPAHYDQLTGVQSVSAGFISEWWSRPITTGAHFTYIPAGRQGGTHEIRAGFEYEHASLRTFDGYAGNQIFWDFGGPSEVEVWDGATYRPSHSRKTVYAQDAWRAADRLTLNLGLRAGVYGGGVPGKPGAFSAHSVSPRVGIAWDVTSNHRTVVRAHYGRYHDAMVTSFYDFLDPLSQTPSTVYTVAGPNQFVDPYTYPTRAAASIDPGVKYSFDDEFLLGVERQLPWNISAKAQYISRDFKDSIGFIDPARIWLPVQKIDPGPDGRVGTADDGGALTVFYDQDPARSAPLLTNPKGAYRRYHGVQFIGARRYAKQTEFQVSYTWSRTVGSYNNAFSSNAANNDLGINGVFVNPNRAINAEGRTPQDFTHVVKVLGTCRVVPWGGLNVSGVYRYLSGRPWARSASGFGAQTQLFAIIMEPRATRHLPALNALDLRVEKTWKPAQKLGTLGAFADVFNVGNQGIALGVNAVSGPNFGLPNNWLEPRALRAGLRMMF